jgi:unsaturated rhamnogalacturonyl hydrolase
MIDVLKYAKLCCDTKMRSFPNAGDLPPSPKFHYHAGVFLSGMEGIYKLTGEEKYSDYIKAYIDAYVDEEGVLHNAHTDDALDDIQPCILMYRYWDEEPRYRKVLDTIVPTLLDWPKTPTGGYWHKISTCPNQVWLDSMYMSGEIVLHYGLLTGDRRYIDATVAELETIWNNMRDEETGLLYHAWDYSKQTTRWQPDPETGLSSYFWGRALGWYVVASSLLSEMLGDDPAAKQFTEHAIDITKAVLKFQDPKTGMWYQVVDKLDGEGNWLETSCSCLFLYGVCNLIRRGLLDKKYVEDVKRGFEGIINEKTCMDGEDFIIKDICIGTGVGDYEHYINRPRVENDLHGTGAFLLMCGELEKLQRTFPELF